MWWRKWFLLHESSSLWLALIGQTVCGTWLRGNAYMIAEALLSKWHLVFVARRILFLWWLTRASLCLCLSVCTDLKIRNSCTRQRSSQDPLRETNETKLYGLTSHLDWNTYFPSLSLSFILLASPWHFPFQVSSFPLFLASPFSFPPFPFAPFLICSLSFIPLPTLLSLSLTLSFSPFIHCPFSSPFPFSFHIFEVQHGFSPVEDSQETIASSPFH